MVQSRAERRKSRESRVAKAFGLGGANAALDVFELLEFAWHDCYGDVSPPDDVIEDVIVASQGDLGALPSVALLALTDPRDLRVAADSVRSKHA